MQGCALASEGMDGLTALQTHKGMVGVIGGQGAFGRWCVRLFEQQGHPVQISDLHSPLSNVDLIRSSSVVVVAVPIGATAAVLAEVAEHIRPNSLLVELTSVKTPFVDALSGIPAPVLSLHPMFSPRVRDHRGEVCIVCKSQEPGGLGEYVERVLSAEGLELVRMGPDEHDRAMAVVQGLTHLQSLAAGHCLAALGFDPEASLAVASPVYRIRMAMIGRVVAQDPRLYAEIEMFNPHVKAVLQQLEHSTNLLARLIERSDLAGFVAEVSGVKDAFGRFCEIALKESDAMIEAVRQQKSQSDIVSDAAHSQERR